MSKNMYWIATMVISVVAPLVAQELIVDGSKLSSISALETPCVQFGKTLRVNQSFFNGNLFEENANKLADVFLSKSDFAKLDLRGTGLIDHYTKLLEKLSGSASIEEVDLEDTQIHQSASQGVAILQKLMSREIFPNLETLKWRASDDFYAHDAFKNHMLTYVKAAQIKIETIFHTNGQFAGILARETVNDITKAIQHNRSSASIGDVQNKGCTDAMEQGQQALNEGGEDAAKKNIALGRKRKEKKPQPQTDGKTAYSANLSNYLGAHNPLLMALLGHK